MAVGRTRFGGSGAGPLALAFSKSMMRQYNRTFSGVRPRMVHHISQLPPARDNERLVVYVAGVTKALYVSNGTTWTAL